MSIEDNKALARRYMQAVMDGDIETVADVQHPDISWWILGNATLDKTAFTEAVRQGILAAKKRTITITGLTAEGDRVAVMAEGEMVFPDKVYKNYYHNLLVIRDGLIVEGREYMDTLAVQKAFG